MKCVGFACELRDDGLYLTKRYFMRPVGRRKRKRFVKTSLVSREFAERFCEQHNLRLPTVATIKAHPQTETAA